MGKLSRSVWTPTCVFSRHGGCFLIGSMLSGGSALHASTHPVSKVYRGLGAGGVLPVTLTIIGDLYDMKTRAKVQVFVHEYVGSVLRAWGGSRSSGALPYRELFLAVGWIFFVNLPFGFDKPCIW